jgi:hypothetical protein
MVKVMSAAPHFLRGELVGVVAASAPRRVRIPVTAG